MRALDLQSELISAILTPNIALSGFDPQGLDIYRRSLRANACRALGISFPTAEKLLGAEAFAASVAAYLAYAPPIAGDWGVWGESFPTWLDQQQMACEFPYVSDCARLDWLCHMAERAPDTSFEWESLLDLTASDPYSCRLVLSPGIAMLTSPFPIVDIWCAHQDEAGMEIAALQRVSASISAGAPQIALVWRKQWKAHVRALTNTELLWFSLLKSNCSLGNALDQMAGSEFSFTTWLIEAIREKTISHTTHTRLNY